jgi:hypothetical protein
VPCRNGIEMPGHGRPVGQCGSSHGCEIGFYYAERPYAKSLRPLPGVDILIRRGAISPLLAELTNILHILGKMDVQEVTQPVWQWHREAQAAHWREGDARHHVKLNGETGDTLRSPTVIPILQRLAVQAARDPKRVCTTLTHPIDEDFPHEAYRPRASRAHRESMGLRPRGTPSTLTRACALCMSGCGADAIRRHSLSASGSSR